MSLFLNTKKRLSVSVYKFVFIFLLFLSGINIYGTEVKTKGEILLDSLTQIISSKPNEALKLGFQILELPASEVHDSIRAFTKVEIGVILDKQGFPVQSLTFYLQGLDLLTEIGMRNNCGYLMIDIGNVYFYQEQFDLASEKYNEAIKVFESQKFLPGIYTSVNNLGLIEREKKNYEKAKQLFNKALAIAEQLPDIPYLKAHSYNYLGDLYKTIGLTDSAISYYDKAMAIDIKEKGHNLIGLNHQKTAQILLDKGDTLSAISHLKLAEIDFTTDYNVFHLVKLYITLFDVLKSIKRQSEAIAYLDRALKIADEKEMITEQINILKKYNEYYQSTGRLQLLNNNLMRINELLEKRYQADVTSLIQKIDTQHLVEEYKQKIKINELELERSKLIRNGAIAAAFSFLIFLWLLFVRFQYRKKLHLQILASREEAYAKELEIEKLKKEKADRELVIQAANIQSQNDFLSNLKKQLKHNSEISNEGNDKSLKKIISLIDGVVNKETTWKQFEEQFVKIHPDFFKKLTEKYPSLTTNELKLCAYHKMNLGTKEIASLAALSVRAIQTSRYRLRKKLNIPEETTFQEFINKL